MIAPTTWMCAMAGTQHAYRVRHPQMGVHVCVNDEHGLKCEHGQGHIQKKCPIKICPLKGHAFFLLPRSLSFSLSTILFTRRERERERECIRDLIHTFSFTENTLTIIYSLLFSITHTHTHSQLRFLWNRPHFLSVRRDTHTHTHTAQILLWSEKPCPRQFPNFQMLLLDPY